MRGVTREGSLGGRDLLNPEVGYGHVEDPFGLREGGLEDLEPIKDLLHCIPTWACH